MSAGADVATARGVDPESDADDRNAAQRHPGRGQEEEAAQEETSRSTTGAGSSPLAALVLVGGIFGIVKMAIAPPTAETLLGTDRVGPGPEDRKRAAVAEYLKHYGDRTTRRREGVRLLDRDLKVAERERVLLNRHRNERLAAARAEETTTPTRTRRRWPR